MAKDPEHLAHQEWLGYVQPVGLVVSIPALLAAQAHVSRKYQNVVSTQLAEQVLAALFELLRGFQAADDQRKGELLRLVLNQHPNQVYSGLLTVLMRLVFILYAEDRGLLSSDPIYSNYYSVTGLFDRLRADAGRFPDTMDQRYGSWPQLLTLFRMIHEGGQHAEFHIPARKGYLFDPDRYPFLEGQIPNSSPDIPRVSDGVIFRVLNNLLILDGERLSYRTLDVEQIGSVYEAIMGFYLEVAQGRSIAIKPTKSHGAPATINVEHLLTVKPADRAKWLAEQSDQKLTGQSLDALKKAETLEDLLAALERKIAREVTPNLVPKGAMIFQPSDERRRSGSHYTPRSLTEPIVGKTLEPILQRLGDSPTPQQILDLKVCDPAMGSAAFLVEACRQLGDVLVKAWHLHNLVPRIPPDEDEVLHARRLIAQRCLYGVDKNPMAVDLAKLSLWLTTLAKDHPFTFLDHALRHGDSLVGLTRKQIADFHWLPAQQRSFGQDKIEERIKIATRSRREIIEADDDSPFVQKDQKLRYANEALAPLRFIGNLVIAAFFAGANERKRKQKREELLSQLVDYLSTGNLTLRPTKVEQELLAGDNGVCPFHWEIEFLEVFERESSGFDAIVGNPPFVGVKNLGETSRECYTDWLRDQNSDSGGKCDLVAFFFRRAHQCLRNQGTLGFIATKTVGQGDTRRSGLAFLLRNGATLYAVTKRLAWPGQAAVIVSVVHLAVSDIYPPFLLNGVKVKRISSYLLNSEYDDDPHQLHASTGFGFLGSKLLGMGFIFDDNNVDCPPTPLIKEVVLKRPESAHFIKPYIGGEELNSISRIEYTKKVIDFGIMDEASVAKHPELLKILEEYVRPQRQKSTGSEKERWWQYAHRASNLYEAISTFRRFLVLAQYSQTFGFAFISPGGIINSKLVGFATDRYSRFAVLQSRVHEGWARFLSGTLKDDLQYTPSACLVTFPFPDWKNVEFELDRVGEQTYELRSQIMEGSDYGLTKTYNRFHDPHETSPEIRKLRELHSAMDRAVLDAYGWTDLQPTCEFLLDYEEEEDEEPTTRRGRKKPWRLRWPDEFRDEVLARLLELNKKRAEQERLAGVTTNTTASGTKRARRSRKNSPDGGNDPAQPKFFE